MDQTLRYIISLSEVESDMETGGVIWEEVERGWRRVCVCVGIISIFKSCYFPFLSQQQPEADNYTDMLSLKK